MTFHRVIDELTDRRMPSERFVLRGTREAEPQRFAGRTPARHVRELACLEGVQSRYRPRENQDFWRVRRHRRRARPALQTFLPRQRCRRRPGPKLRQSGVRKPSPPVARRETLRASTGIHRRPQRSSIGGFARGPKHNPGSSEYAAQRFGGSLHRACLSHCLIRRASTGCHVPIAVSKRPSTLRARHQAPLSGCQFVRARSRRGSYQEFRACSVHHAVDWVATPRDPAD